MAGPIGHGVRQGMRRDRKQPTAPASAATAWLYFLLITVCLSWLTVAVLGEPSLHPGWLAAALAWQSTIGAWLARLAAGDDAASPRGALRAIADLGWLGFARRLALARWGRTLGHALHALAWLAWLGPILAYAAGALTD